MCNWTIFIFFVVQGGGGAFRDPPRVCFTFSSFNYAFNPEKEREYYHDVKYLWFHFEEISVKLDSSFGCPTKIGCTLDNLISSNLFGLGNQKNVATEVENDHW